MRAKKITPKKLIGDFITLKQLLQSLPLSERTIRNYIDGRKLRAYKLDGMLVFNVLDVQAFLKRRAVGGGSAMPIIQDAPEVSNEELAQAIILKGVRMLTDDEVKEAMEGFRYKDENGHYSMADPDVD